MNDDTTKMADDIQTNATLSNLATEAKDVISDMASDTVSNLTEKAEDMIDEAKEKVEGFVGGIMDDLKTKLHDMTAPDAVEETSITE